MKFPHRLVLMITLALYILIPHIEAEVEGDGPTQKLISSICKETEDYDLCNKIIHKNLKTPTTNLKDLTYLILRISIEHASDTYIFIGNILRERPGREETTCLNTCLTAYSEETNIFLTIRHEFLQGEYERMIRDILSTTKILKKCRTDFRIPPYKENPIVEKNRVMKILITMSTVSGFMVKNEFASLLSSVVGKLNLFSMVN